VNVPLLVAGHITRSQSEGGRGLPPHQPLLLQRLCSGYRLNLLVLGFNVLMLVAICVIGSQRAQLEEELRILKENFSHFSSGVEGRRKWLSFPFSGGGASSQLTSLEAKLEKQQRDVKADHATLLLHLKHFPSDLRILTCQVAFFQSNGTDCCPVNWLEYEGSCYWFSRSGKTWEEAENFRGLEPSSPPVFQKFILQHTNPFDTWIGLTDSDGSWRWVDGTDYQQSYKNWAATQPDDWQGHEVGGGEDCAEVRANGRWNDNFCKQVQRWVCEMSTGCHEPPP
uniref:C-type lectin domain-containing protein n=1 Tax=Canis lupus familiaris TaxID=9615 RepID=A0A8C0MY88_CANLF